MQLQCLAMQPRREMSARVPAWSCTLSDICKAEDGLLSNTRAKANQGIPGEHVCVACPVHVRFDTSASRPYMPLDTALL